MGKKILACLTAILLLCSSLSAFAAAPEVTTQSVCIMDADTGEIIYEKNANVQVPMASITKVMSALVVFENGDLTASTTATAKAMETVDLQSTRVGFVPDEQLTIDTLMYCMLVYSANDAANILAEAVGGSVEEFVQMMNDKAAELGCVNTHFMNPNGLDEDGHYTTAHDMALITRAANQYPEFAKYSSAVSYQLPADNVIPEGWRLDTKVDMFVESKETYDARVYAGKTGWTTNAHNTFVCCARTADESNYIISLLTCPAKGGIFMDTKLMLDYLEKEYPAVNIPADDYRDAVKEAAKNADIKADMSALEDLNLHLPLGMTAADLAYNVTADETQAHLEVGIVKEKQAAFQTETGLNGAQPVLSIPLELKQSSPEDAGSAAPVEAADVPESKLQMDTDRAHALAGRFMAKILGMPEVARDILLVAAIVVCAFILMIVLLFFLGLYRQIRNRRRRRRAKRKARTPKKKK